MCRLEICLNTARIVSKHLNFLSMSFFFRLEKSHLAKHVETHRADIFQPISTPIYLFIVDFHWASSVVAHNNIFCSKPMHACEGICLVSRQLGMTLSWDKFKVSQPVTIT